MNRLAWKDYDLEKLFKQAATAGLMYADECAQGERIYGGDYVMPALDTLPDAMLWKVRVVEQYLDEIKQRAWDIQQEKYDAKSTVDKIKWHEEESADITRMLKGELDRDPEYVKELEGEIQMHESYKYVLTENESHIKYTFGDK